MLTIIIIKILSMHPSKTQWKSNITIPSILFRSLVNRDRVVPSGVLLKYYSVALVIEIHNFLCIFDMAVSVPPKTRLSLTKFATS
jgi:hypothetical protein